MKHNHKIKLLHTEQQSLPEPFVSHFMRLSSWKYTEKNTDKYTQVDNTVKIINLIIINCLIIFFFPVQSLLCTLETDYIWSISNGDESL